MQDIEKLNDQAAIKALSHIVRQWSEHRGLETVTILTQTRDKASAAFESSPVWALRSSQISSEAGDFARKMLGVLASGSDDEVAVWTEKAVKAQLEAKAHVLDPVSLSIIGGTIIGAILAARVKKMGSSEFYKGVPKELAEVMKIGSSVLVPKEP